MADELKDKIAENAAGPKRAKGDSSEIEQHSIADQILADKYLTDKDNQTNKRLGVRFLKMIPPGAD